VSGARNKHPFAAVLLAAAVLAWHAAAEDEQVPAPPPMVPEETPKPNPNSNPGKAAPEPGPLPQDPPGGDDDEDRAETIPLPPERPADVPPVAKTDPEAVQPPAIVIENGRIQPGEKVIFKLYGSEPMLRAAAGVYSIEDEMRREVVRGTVRVADLAYAEGKPRQIEVAIPAAITPKHKFTLALASEGFGDWKLNAEFEVVQKQSWQGFMALVSAPPPNGNWPALRSLGITGGVQYRMHPARREALLKGDVPFYVENVTRGLLSRYHTERGLWEKTISGASDPNNPARLHREPSLCSTEFAELFAKEIKKHAEFYAKDEPLFYSLASEPSVTRLAAAMDFDFSPQAVAEFQRWLERDVYGTLASLNKSWETNFKSWQDVVPMTTDDARLRLRDGVMNFAPWADFRAFQDDSFARVLRGGGEVLKSFQPRAKVGITGAMGAFAFGGWDWSRLAQSLDVVESYDIGQSRSLWRDLAPGKPAFATLSLPSDAKAETLAGEARSSLWSLALEGGQRGVLLWDVAANAEQNASALVDGEGKPTPLGEALAPTLRTLAGEAGTLLAHCRREDDGVALLYSPASIRLHWLFEADALHGGEWLTAWGANTAGERRDSPYLRLRESWGKLLEDLGLSWRWVSSAQVAAGGLLKPESRIKVLVLPQALALSDIEVDAIRKFVQNGGRIVADAACGRFDEHGKLRAVPALDEIFDTDTSREPFLPRAMNPLEILKGASLLPEELNGEGLRNFPPVFSDAPKWPAAAAKKTAAAEYRGSPVCLVSDGGAFLNLDLSDYLRWRLHPDRPRAEIVRTLLKTLVFQKELAQARIDWSASQLPYGTQVIWLRPEGGTGPTSVLALRRNPQARLHELGTDAEGNWAFEKAEPFKLTLRGPVTAWGVSAGAKSEERPVRKLEGRLDPSEPLVYVLQSAPALPFGIEAHPAAVAGQSVELKLTPPQERGAGALYHLKVQSADGGELAHYTTSQYTADGKATLFLPLACNDPAGIWVLTVRDWLSGAEQKIKLEVKAAVRP